jgi:hypothetical protein
MAANVAITKEAFITQLVALAAQLTGYAGSNNDEMIAYYFANFQGTNVFVDADFSATGACKAQPWLTAGIVTAMITTMQALQTTLTAAQRNNIRAVESGPLPLG